MSLLARRRGMMGAKKSGGLIPKEYQQVEWIGYSQNSCYFNTGVVTNNVKTVKARIARWAAPTTATVFPNAGSSYFGSLENISGSKFSVQPSKARTDLFDFTEFTATKTGGASSNPIMLGWTSSKYVSDMGYASLKLYDASDTLLFDGIPCYRKADNAIGMYDLISNRFEAATAEYSYAWTKGADVT